MQKSCKVLITSFSSLLSAFLYYFQLLMEFVFSLTVLEVFVKKFGNPRFWPKNAQNFSKIFQKSALSMMDFHERSATLNIHSIQKLSVSGGTIYSEFLAI